MTIFDIDNIAVNIIGYPISFVELIGTVFGFLSVYFASKTNILTWPTGIVNELFLFILFFQIQLYADMFLQLFFFIVTLFGWYQWRRISSLNKITSIGLKTSLWMVCIIIAGTMITGILFSNIHLYLPQFFKTKAAFPFADSLVMVSSIIATVLLANKKIETWLLWIAIDLICVFLFFKKGVVFLGLEYLIFLGLATYGLMNWQKEMKNA
jgi:nicotinamide mononucleotide transporter